MAGDTCCDLGTTGAHHHEDHPDPRAPGENLGTTEPGLSSNDAELSTIHSPYYDNALSMNREKESHL
jgi:hypothetical protein